ncbi:MAG TPA: hypothetical protein VIK54_03065 [Acidimicrobiia bacterium]
MLDLDVVLDLDVGTFGLDGEALGSLPVAAHGGGTPVHFRPFVPRKELIVGTAAAELGPLEAHAAAVRTLDIRAEEDVFLLLFL